MRFSRSSFRKRQRKKAMTNLRLEEKEKITNEDTNTELD
jgi:hypothetical protein